MKKLLLVLFFANFQMIPFAQTSIDAEKVRLNNVNSREAIQTFDLTRKTVVLQFFYNEDWTKAQILGEEMDFGDDLRIKYDLLNQQINILIDDVPMVASNKMLKSFTFSGTGQKFICINPKNWDKGKSFFEIIVEGNHSLLGHHSATKQKANYNAALDIGSKNEQIVQKETFYILTNGRIAEIPTKKKAAHNFFKKYKGASYYIKRNKINFKQKEDIKKLIQFLNRDN